ncbi:MAG: leucine-rich repeat domain-containing protein [Mogibacterium sp.]|nr:leucine-rich repeat domain-containing protein [Mogibacterium sp.]
MSVTITGDRLIRYEDAAVHYCVPQHIRYIEDLAFSGADNLVSLEIPDSVEHIGSYVFRMCYALEEISMPERIDSIGAGLFQHCWKLKSAKLPEGTLMIGGEMFESCHALTTLELPDSLRKIDRSAFSGCRNLREIIINPEKLKMLPPAARYAAVLTYMERHSGTSSDCTDKGSVIIDEFASDRQGNLLDLAINRRSAEAVRYMLNHDLIAPDALAGYLEKSAERNRVEITALMLEYGQNISKDDLFNEDPFA